MSEYDYGPPKEAPDCGACNDNGCKECRPSRLRVRWWTMQGWFRARCWWRQFDNNAPF